MDDKRLIDANELKRRLIEGDGHDDDRFTEGYNFAINEIRGYIADALTVEIQPVKHGRWELISQNKFAGSKTLRCTYCKNYFVVRDDTLNAGRGDANFCTNCGAKMNLKEI